MRRLEREGITDCFGVAGDFAFKLCDAVARSEAVRWVGCSNELDAAYAADVGTMGRNGLKPVIFVLNNGGYLVERALEANPDWVYNDLAPWNYHALPAALGCRGWFTAKVTTLGELDAGLARAATSESASYVEVVTDRMDMPAGLALPRASRPRGTPTTSSSRHRAATPTWRWVSSNWRGAFLKAASGWPNSASRTRRSVRPWPRRSPSRIPSPSR